MKKLKKAIIIMIMIIIVIIITIILLINQQKNNTKNNIESYSDNNSTIETANSGDNSIIADSEINVETPNNTIKYVQSRIEYFNIKSIYDKYLSLISENSGDELINLMSKEYCKIHHLNKDNIVNSTGIKAISNSRDLGTYTSIISDILVADTSENMKVYFVYGKYLLKATGKIDTLNLMIILDSTSMLYDIYPYSYMMEKQYYKLKVNDKMETIHYSIEDKNINKISDVLVEDKKFVNILFDDWNNIMLYDTKKAYNKLNKNYSEKRFPNYTNFQNYLNSRKYISNINEYRVYSTNNYTDYVCTDQYNNYYIFRQQGGIMRYTVFLDSYTVELDTFKENYEQAEENTKVAIQIGRVKQMLNSKDYNAIYNKLNSTFKKNNYATVNKLEQYLKNNTYDINTIEIEECSKKEDYYVCTCILSNQKNTNEHKNMTIVIKLIDSNNFEMSFNI